MQMMVTNHHINFTHPNSAVSQMIEYTGLTGPVGIQCDPKTLSGIVFLPHQSQLKYVETVSLQCVDVEFNVLSQNVVRNRVIYHTHHSYTMYNIHVETVSLRNVSL